MDPERQRGLLARCGLGREANGDLKELTILSTCNRTELYATVDTADAEPLERWLAEASGVSRERLRPYLYRLNGLEAARHLLRVTAGLDSLVLGEPQILGQVAEAHGMALRHGASGPILSRLFQTAIHAGKRARSETRISHNPATVSSAAVGLAAAEVGELAAARVLVIGAGETAELVVEALRQRSVKTITVVNRTAAHARLLADRWQAQAQPFEALPSELALADIVISSTSAPHTILDREALARALAARPCRPMVVIDIALPRDVDPEAADLAGLSLYDLDRLNAFVADSVEERQREVPQVERLIEEELDTFAAWMGGQALTPLIAAMHRQAEAIRRRELAYSLRRLPELGEQEQRRIDAFSRALVRKLLHNATLCLREGSLNGNAALYAEVTRALFGLAEPRPGETASHSRPEGRH